MRLKGSDIWEFMRTWPPGSDWYYDYFELEVEDSKGQPLIDMSKTYDGSQLGTLCWQGGREMPNRVEMTGGSSAPAGCEVQAAIRAWLKASTVARFCVDVPKEEAEAFKTLCRERGWACT